MANLFLQDRSLPCGSHLSAVSLPYIFYTDPETLPISSPEPENRTSHSSVNTKVSDLNLRYTIDLRAITFEGTVDENLVCPICRCPFIDPVLTDCDHVFCRACIDDSLSHSKFCPVDRLPLSQDTIARAPKMVFNQLDSLKTKCPCCNNVLARAGLESHLEKYCLEAMVRCPGFFSEQGCTQVLKRRLSTQQCPHYLALCPDCSETVEQIGMEAHRQLACSERTKVCDSCSIEILRYNEIQHETECPDIMQTCKWTEYGCQHEAKRKDLYLHADDCHFKSIGPMAEYLKGEIQSLQNDVRSLTETNQLQERRIKFLESGQKTVDRPMEFMDLSLANMPESATADSLDSGHDYLLSLLETQQNRLSHLSAEVSDFQRKNTMMLFNETLPIKNELAELRSTQQVTCMHVRWLMRFRMQENQRRFGGSPGPASSGGPDGGNGFGNEPQLSRRLSDSSRDVITKL
jgi:TNF receptor-associated factor 5